MKRNDYLFVATSFIAWRALLFVFVWLAIKFVPLQNNFIGGGRELYATNPHFWGWGNFDGEHYVEIARYGYKPLTYFYFPLYPTLISFLTSRFGNTISNYIYSGLFVSHVSFFLSLVGFYKLALIDFSPKIVRRAVVLLLLFPTSFYFASIYTESLFLCFIIWAFYFARKRNWILAGLVGALAAATRSTGIYLLPALFVEFLVFYFSSVPRQLALGRATLLTDRLSCYPY